MSAPPLKKQDRMSTYALNFRDHYRKKRRMAMGMARRAEWIAWHADPIAAPLDPKSQPDPRTKFQGTAVGYDKEGIPLVNNPSGLGLGLGLNSGEKQKKDWWEIHRRKALDALRYDPSVSKFVMGNGSQTQRAAPLYNSTRPHAGTRFLHSHGSEGANSELARPRRGAEGEFTEARLRSLHDTGHAYRFPRHPGDTLPLSHPPSLPPANQPYLSMAQVGNTLTGVGSEVLPRQGYPDFVPATSRLPPITAR